MFFLRNFKSLTTSLIILITLSLSQLAMSNSLLAVDDAFKLHTPVVEDNKIIITWDIADGYYLYKERTGVVSDDITLENLEFISKGIPKDDPFFGNTEVFANQLIIHQFFSGNAEQAEITIKYQGCEKAQGVCYPPQARTFLIDIPVQTLSAAPSSATGLAVLNSLFSLPNTGNDLLPADEAFQLSTTPTGQGQLLLTFKVASGYYLYKDKIQIEVIDGIASIGYLDLPAAKMTDDPAFGRMAVYEQDFQALLTVTDIVDSAKIQIQFQGCSSTTGVCFPPIQYVTEINATSFGTISTANATPAQQINAQTSLNDQDLSETDLITRVLSDNSFWIIIATFFVFGLLLSLTPCVLPMVPILSSIIVGQGKNITVRKSFTISVVYVLAMSITYTIAGVLAGVFGGNLQILFQNTWVIASFILIFIALSFSMFGFYELKLPNSLQTKLINTSNKQQNGSYIGVAIMGFLSALIVGPCVTAPLAGALIYIGQTGDALLGGVALFAMSIGMGVPLLLIGASAGKILPKVGGWMDQINVVFGVMLLAVAIWMADRILPSQVVLSLWAALFIGSAVYLGAFNNIADKSGWAKFAKSIGLISFVYGVIIIIGMSAGSNSLLQPLKVLQGSGSSQALNDSQGLDFQKIKSIADVEKIVATDQLVMLDFYADWCVACVQMERFTFTDQNVYNSLVGVTLLKADVTANDQIDKDLMQHFGIVGPPAILFFINGQEIRSQRVVGFKNAEDFNNRVIDTFHN